MIIIVGKEDFKGFQTSLRKQVIAANVLKCGDVPIPSTFLYKATLVAKYEDGDIEIIKNRYQEMEAIEIVKKYMNFFDRKQKIKRLLNEK